MIRLFPFLSRPVTTIVLLLLPIAVFGVYFSLLCYNVPWFDEFEAVLDSLTKLVDAPTLARKWAVLARPNNEHRLVFAHLVVYAYNQLTGQVNFTHLMLLGNATLGVLLWLFHQVLRSRGLPTVYLLPVPLFLFTAQNYLLTFTALYTLQYLAIIILVAFTFYLLAGNTRGRFVGALSLGLFSTFSMGNGLLLWPAGVGILLYQRQWYRLGGWIAVGVMAIKLYFYGYPVQQGNADGFAYALSHPLLTLRGFFVYAGSWLDIFPGWPLDWRAGLPLLGGLVVVGGLIGWGIRALWKSSPQPTLFTGFLLGLALFLLANTALIALFRVRFQFLMVLWSTYRTYTLVLWAVAYLVWIDALPAKSRPRWLPIAWLFALAINGVSYYTYVPEAIERQAWLQGVTFDQAHNGIGLGGSRQFPYLTNYINTTLADVRQRGWYTLPQPAIAVSESRLFQPVTDSLATPTWIIVQRPDYVTVENRETELVVGRHEATYLVCQSSQHTYVMLVTRNHQFGRNPFHRLPGWTAAMPTAITEPGHYRLGLYTKSSHHDGIVWTNHYIRIE